MPWKDQRDLFRQMEYDMLRFTEEALRAFMDSPGGISRFWQPAADVHETEEGIVLKLELAGVTTDSVSVSLSGDGRTLAVTGSRGEADDERAPRTSCHQLEIYFGPFERTFRLPEEFEVERDGITATLKNGFLTIQVPRRLRTLPQARTIPIEVER
jgi:HSP20 family protein